ncbi:NUDIX domain-containing protein [Nitrogeniibacter mangrovi]|uniref:NUDIX domain-containing protein n=1 Tax=Nitrogeniibacter mangrovi TaxID=2016596 RepID=A0A6C1BC50_9RHOO|nr:NUDIX domain-containing protein [Nitrogeniibacter mangrovi]
MTGAGIPTGVHVIFEHEGRILLMRRANTGFFDGLYSLPGGHVEAGESVLMAAVREMAEELAVHVEPDRLATVGVVHRRSDTNRIDFFLRAERWTGTPRRAEPDKCDDLAWFSRDALPVATVAYVREALARTGEGPWIVETGWPGCQITI